MYHPARNHRNIWFFTLTTVKKHNKSLENWRLTQLASSVFTTLQQRLPLGATDFQRLLNHVETQVPSSGQELGTWKPEGLYGRNEMIHEMMN